MLQNLEFPICKQLELGIIRLHKVGCVLRMGIVSIQIHAEFGTNDHRETHPTLAHKSFVTTWYSFHSKHGVSLRSGPFPWSFSMVLFHGYIFKFYRYVIISIEPPYFLANFGRLYHYLCSLYSILKYNMM